MLKLIFQLFLMFFKQHVFAETSPDKKKAAEDFGVGDYVEDDPPADDPPADDPPETDEELPEPNKEGKYSIGGMIVDDIEGVKKLISEMEDDAFMSFNTQKLTKAELMEKFKVEDAGDTDPDTITEGKDRKIKLGDKIEIEEKDFAKIYEKVSKEITKETWDKLSDKDQEKLLMKEYSLQQASIAQNQRNQQTAEERKKWETEQAEARRDILASSKENELERKKIEDTKTELEAEKTRLESLTQKDPDDEEDDKKRRKLEVEQVNAETRLPQIEKELKQLDKTAGELQVKTMVNYYLYQSNVFLAQHPEFKPAEGLSFEIISQQVEDKKFTGDKVDLLRYKIFDRVYVDYLKESPEYRKKNTMADYYDAYKEMYPALPEDAKAKSEKPKAKSEKKAKTYADLFNEIHKRQKNGVSYKTGDGPGLHTPDKAGVSAKTKQRQENAKKDFGIPGADDYS